ncbi:putative repressor LexA [Clostridium sp. CAG:413]|nr:putative repressor LexA [Clostridium sp. CAG:413]
MNNLRAIRKNRNYSMKNLGELIGMSESTISQYETGKRQPDPSTLIKLAEVLNTTVDCLLGLDSNLSPINAPLTAGAKIKVFGRVPAGIPVEAIEDIIDEIEISEKMANDDHEYLALLVTGESMLPIYQDGDIVIIRKKETANTGDDVVAYVNGYDATLKRLQRYKEGIRLKALNPNFESKFYTNAQIESLPVRILGIVVEMRRTMK